MDGLNLDYEVSVIHIGRSVATVVCLMWAASYTLPVASPIESVRWAAAVVLLGGAYYALYHFWRSCKRRRRGGGAHVTPLSTLSQAAYSDVASQISASDGDGRIHLTTVSVYVYVYGWGVLLFISLYCLAGLKESSSCWWAAGMLMLSFDELVMREVNRTWVTLIHVLMWVTTVSLWWSSCGVLAAEEDLGTILLGVVFPVLVPFIFFSLRSSVLIVSRDVWTLCEVALPFMILISLAVIISGLDSNMTLGLPTPPDELQAGAPDPEARRPLLVMTNASGAYIETPGLFGWNDTQQLPIQQIRLDYARINKYVVLIFVPILAGSALINVVTCVVHGFVTEFITSFLLVLTVKYAVTHADMSGTTMLSLSSAASGFIIILLLQRAL